MNFYSQEKNEELNKILHSIDSDSEREKVIEIFMKLCHNLLKEPNNETYKKLRKSNKVLTTYIYCKPNIIQLLYYLGFSEFDLDGEQYLVIFDVDFAKLSNVTKRLEEILSNIHNKSPKVYQNQTKPIDKLILPDTIIPNNKSASVLLRQNLAEDQQMIITNKLPSSINTINNPTNLLKETASLRKNMIPETPIITQPRDMSSVRFSNMTNNSIVPEYYQNGLTTKSIGKSNMNSADEIIGRRCLDLTNEFRKMNNLGALK